MSTIKVKRTTGSTTPTGLTFGEPAFVDGLNSFYVTKDNGTSVRVGAEVDTSTALGSSDNKIPTQLAVKTYVDGAIGGGAVSTIEGLTGAVNLEAGTGIAIVTAGQDITFTNVGVQSVSGTSNEIEVSGATGAVTIGLPNDVTITGNLAVNGGDITTTDTTANIFASNATSIYLGANAATDVRIGKSDNAGTTRLFGTVQNPGGTITGAATQNVYDTTSTTVNAFGVATSLDIGYDGTSSSTTNIATGSLGLGNTRTINIGTGAAGSSTTNINLGSAGGGTVTVNKYLVVTGDLTINGTTTTVNSTTLTVDDKNIEIGSVGSPTDITADGGGITLKGSTDKTIIWDNANDNWTSSEHWNLASGKVFKINNTEVLSSTTLGSAVVSSSLTSVGTIATGTWQATDIGLAYGGTNASLTAANGGVVYSTASELAISAVGTSGQVLTSAGAAAPTWTSQSSLSVGTATNLAGGGAGQIAYQSGAGSTTFLTTSSTAGAVVASTGTGTAPEYKVISFTNGSVTSGSGTLTLAVQDAAADGTTKGIAAFNATNFDAASGVISIDTVDGGSY